MASFNIGKRFGIAACAAALILLAVAAIGGGAFAGASAAPMVSEAWIKLPVVPGRPAAAYARVTGGKTADRLIAIEGPPPSRLELHTTLMERGVMRMQPAGVVPIAANAALTMQPGGMHIMVFDLPATKPDARVPLVFVFEKAGRISVSAQAMAANAPHDAHAHH